MIPRVFVSSTYYDLKYVRERLEKFIDNFGFESVLFESDKVTYQQEKELDQSAYYEVSLCHIMILIIGGRYGSPSTTTNIEEERRKYDESYVSITRKEFETAISKNIPVFIFVDKNVFSEYQTYKENQEIFDTQYSSSEKIAKGIPQFKFAHVDHVNVFRFLDLVRNKPIKTFEKVEEIESYIKTQLSGLFYLYLESLKKKSDDKKILDTVSQLNNVILSMNEMMKSVGGKILQDDKVEYEKVINSQFSILLDFYIRRFDESLEFENKFSDVEINEIDLDALTKVIYDKALNINVPKPAKTMPFREQQKFNTDTYRKLFNDLRDNLYDISEKVILKSLNIRSLNYDLKEKVTPFIRNNENFELLLERLKDVIKWKLNDLPF